MTNFLFLYWLFNLFRIFGRIIVNKRLFPLKFISGKTVYFTEYSVLTDFQNFINFIFSQKLTDFTDYAKYSVFYRIFGFDRLFKNWLFLDILADFTDFTDYTEYSGFLPNIPPKSFCFCFLK